MGLEPTTSTLRVRRAIHCATALLDTSEDIMTLDSTNCLVERVANTDGHI